MKIVLKRDIKNVGKVGDIVAVKDGYGRNFLLPKGYAVVATKSNIEKLQEKINELKKQNEILIEKSKIVADLLSKQVFNVVKQVADDDTMYGSIRTKDIYLFICDLLKKNNIDFSFDIGSIKVSEPIKMLGKYLINIELFSGVDGILRLNICRAIADFEDDVNEFDKKREKSLSLSKELKNSGDLKQDKSFLNQKKEKSDIKEDISDDGDKKDLKDEAK